MVITASLGRLLTVPRHTFVPVIAIRESLEPATEPNLALVAPEAAAVHAQPERRTQLGGRAAPSPLRFAWAVAAVRGIVAPLLGASDVRERITHG